MALNKQSVNVNFQFGVDTKTDPYQIPIGKFKNLVNSVFDTTNRLTKRNGFGKITTLPNDEQTTLATLNDSLVATGNNLYSYNTEVNSWTNKGSIQPVNLDVLSVVRSSTSQSSPDMAIDSSGLACVVYADSAGGSYYQIVDSVTGQQLISKTLIAATAKNARTFVLGRYFIITFTATVSAASHLQYKAIPISMPGSPGMAQDISTSIPSLDTGYDAFVSNSNLYIGWGDTGTTVQAAYLSSTLTLSAPSVLPASVADLMSVTVDESGSSPTVWLAYWDSNTQNAYAAAFNFGLVNILAPVLIIDSTEITEITSIANDSQLRVFYENYNTYENPYPVSSVQTDFISTVLATEVGSVSATTDILRSVGLASKPFVGPDEQVYMVVAYGEINQPTYFLIDTSGNIYLRLAYANGGGYASSQVLSSVTGLDGSYYFSYMIKDFLATVNKNTDTNVSPSTVNAIYTQTGINFATFSINSESQVSSEIAQNLHLTGGQLWQYDGVKPVEHGFHVWPENLAASPSTMGGELADQIYFYQATYEWTDGQGNLYRSAPSLPLQVDLSDSGTDTNSVDIYVPTLRLTYKIDNPVRIVVYRWSEAQQTYYQITSITQPVENDVDVDYVVVTDELSDAQILGQTLLYTTGGVVENIAAPACISTALFKNRMFLIDAENRNSIWYSKQVIQGVPVEFSDLFTLYIAPTTGAQGSTGPATALSALDDKLIVFKKDAIYYLTGTGPDNTGGNNDFGDFVYITSSVGCDNPDSIVLTPMGLMFQSDKGIWLLGRDLSTKYIGAAVESYNNQPVRSALAIPGTNQIRFTLNNNITLMYDYYYDQWGIFTNLQAIAATLYQGKHTYLNQYGQVFQETPGLYLDGSSPVLMSFITSWINMAGLQGYQRFYFLYLLGTYYTPFKLDVQLAYDYNVGKIQSFQVLPDNINLNWGDEAVWGGGEVWGGPGNVFEARLFPQVQKCESFQLFVNEVYDSSYGIPAAAGLTLSGLNIIVGTKKGYRTQKPSRSFG